MKIIRFSATLLSTFALALTHALAAPGTFDPTYGNGGVVVTPSYDNGYQAAGIAAQADGMTVIVGRSVIYPNFGSPIVQLFVTRYTSSGLLDTSFGSNGFATLSAITSSGATSVVIQPDGKILVAASIATTSAGTTTNEIAVLRYLRNGSPDLTFNGTGMATTRFGSASAAAIALDHEGRILLTGGWYGPNATNGWALARFMPDGKPDLAFNGTGQERTSISGGAGGIAEQPDGKLLVCGGQKIARFDPAGQLDATFGNSGIASFQLSDPTDPGANLSAGLGSVAVQSDGRIVASGSGGPIRLYGRQHFVLLRYTTDGVLDPTFGDGGMGEVPDGDIAGGAMAVQPDGRMILVGSRTVSHSSPNYAVTAIARYTPNGRLDTTFGTGGGGYSTAGGAGCVTLRRDGRIVVAGSHPGYARSGRDGAQLLITRYYGQEPPASDFGTDGTADLVWYNPSSGGVQVEPLSGNVAGGAATLMPNPTPTDRPLVKVTDFDGNGQPDCIFYNPGTGGLGVWFSKGTALDFGTKLPALPAGSQLVGVADFNGDSQPDLLLLNSTTRALTVWLLNGASLASAVPITAGTTSKLLPSVWTIAGVTDFNHDRKPDLVLYHPPTRQTALWYLNGTSFVQQLAGPTIAASWTLAGVADFNSDAQPDFLIFNPATRKTGIWTLNGTTVTNTSYVVDPAGTPIVQPAGWQIVAP